MRIGINPEKENKELIIDDYHRVVIPVFIPNLSDEYFKDGLKILKLCLESLLLTVHDKTKISIINNGSCQEVSDYLDNIYNSNIRIDQLFNSKINLGKVNALYSVIKSNIEPLITIADADVMFLNGWQNAVEDIFSNYPEAGMVSPVPSSKAYLGKFVNSTVFYGLFKAKIEFTDVISPKGLKMFEKSIGRKMYNKANLEKYLIIKKNDSEAVIGCGHFVATLRRQVFNNSPVEVCNVKIVGGSENQYIDKPNDISGFLRLSTKDNYAYHLGNVFEKWMEDTLIEIQNTNFEKPFKYNVSSKVKPLGLFAYKFGGLLHLVLFKKFRKFYFKLKGMKQQY